MTKRSFLRSLACLPLLSFLRLPAKAAPVARTYLLCWPWNKLVGVRFEWPNSRLCPNPCPGSDWEICAAMPDWFTWDEVPVGNWRRNKYAARPIGRKEPLKLLAFSHWTNCDRSVDYSKADLSVGRFYLL